jgi:hypothetical protein
MTVELDAERSAENRMLETSALSFQTFSPLPV